MAEVSDSNTKRILYVNGFELNQIHDFQSNYVSTTKYNLVTFFPLSLLEQYKRLPNVYFLIIVILQSIPQITPLRSWSGLVAVVFILAVSMIREGFEDYLRYKSDKETNSAKTMIYRNGKFEEATFKEVQVGNVVLVQKDEAFPCDLVMLSSSADNGIAYIETSSLDGEKTLKPRQAVIATMNDTRKDDIIRIFSLIECEHPNARLYHFSGSLEYNDKKQPLDKNNLLLAGAFLRNTAWIVGAAVYTGKETKLRQNLMSRKSKQSFIERKTNQYIVGILAAQTGFCVIMAILYGVWSYQEYDDHYYLSDPDYSAGLQGFLNYFTYFLLLNTMLPISLIVSLEIIKIAQGFFMQQDLEMYSTIRDRPCHVSAFSLNEELGMIEHIFSDKTGTLTSNRMQFKLCTVGNKMYGEKQFLISRQYSSKVTRQTKEIIFTFKVEEIENDLYGKDGDAPLSSPVVMEMSYGKEGLYSQKELLDQFVKCMSICHECLIEENENKESNYIGQSPDEIVLVDFAAHIGYKYDKLKAGIMDIKRLHFGMEDQCDLLRFEKCATLEFNSDRKRNSVIVKDLQTNKMILYTKGADSEIKKRLSQENLKAYLDKVSNDLQTYSERGYRTLMFTYKILEEANYIEWKRRFDEASTSIEGREERIDKLAEEIEQDLFLLGCTAVEDSLQDDVPQTIQALLSAGINVWMLTGDKLETAENIGKTCSLVDENMIVERCPGNLSLDDCLECMRYINSRFESEKKDKPAALLIEGGALEKVLFDEGDPIKITKYPELSKSQVTLQKAREIKQLFLKMALVCKTVICCRVTPGEKREIVKLMKDNTGIKTLAVGDGANDVSMILEAHIGVGIYGEEGMQAVQASDYSIGEFKFLWELLLVHGRFNYIRQSEMIMYFFYKNLVFTMPHFFFGFYCAYSGQAFYDDWYITFYNLIFTALPLLMRALFERDIEIPKRSEVGQTAQTKKDLLRHLIPKVYEVGRDNRIFTPFHFWTWNLMGYIHAVAVFFIPLYASEEGIMNSRGYNYSQWGLSVTSFSCIIFVVNFKLGLHTKLWSIYHYIAILGTSILCYFIFIVVYDPFTTLPTAKTLYQMLTTQYYYVCILVAIGFVFTLDYGVQILKKVLWPSVSDKIMKFSIQIRKEQEKDND
ncbi:unnamed protein product [Blepharisma stoltei]|uniref:Phospholipid-transporting ATPase n=1 Tax=Blepharisma stoltei TaxID=1481888 RepID=A0AAU9K705_9CILI|nr:unnamed protein product [Blepharisma stoltei]